MKTAILFFISCALLLAGCTKSYNPPPVVKYWQWHYVRYNMHTIYDSLHHVIATSNDTSSGAVRDTVYFTSEDELYFHRLNYYRRQKTDTVHVFEHIVFDSGDPTCEMKYYPLRDSASLKLTYSTPPYPIVASYSDYGTEYWWTE